MATQFSNEHPSPQLPEMATGFSASPPSAGPDQLTPVVPPPVEALSPIQGFDRLQNFLHDLGLGTDSQMSKTGLETHLFRGADRVRPGDERNIVYQLAEQKARELHHLAPDQYAQQAVEQFDELQRQFRDAATRNPIAAYRELASHLAQPGQSREPIATAEAAPAPAPTKAPAPRTALADIKTGFVNKIRSLWKRGSEAVAKLRESKTEPARTSQERLRDRLVDAEVVGLEAVQATNEDLARIRSDRNQQIEQLLSSQRVEAAFAGRDRTEAVDRRYAVWEAGSRQAQAWSRLRRYETLQTFAQELTQQASERPIGELIQILDTQLDSNRRRRERIGQLIDQLTQHEQDRFGYSSQLGEAELARRQLRAQQAALRGEAMLLRTRRARYENQLTQLTHLQREAEAELRRLEGNTGSAAGTPPAPVPPRAEAA